MSRSSDACNDDNVGRVIAVWRDGCAAEHVIVGAVGEEFEGLKAWIIEHHGHECVAIERRGGDPAPATAAIPQGAPLPVASDAENAACGSGTASEASFDPATLKPSAVFGVLDVERKAPTHTTRSQLSRAARRCGLEYVHERRTMTARQLAALVGDGGGSRGPRGPRGVFGRARDEKRKPPADPTYRINSTAWGPHMGVDD